MNIDSFFEQIKGCTDEELCEKFSVCDNWPVQANGDYNKFIKNLEEDAEFKTLKSSSIDSKFFTHKPTGIEICARNYFLPYLSIYGEEMKNLLSRAEFIKTDKAHKDYFNFTVMLYNHAGRLGREIGPNKSIIGVVRYFAEYSGKNNLSFCLPMYAVKTENISNLIYCPEGAERIIQNRKGY